MSRTVKVFCDESRQNASRYMLQASLWLPAPYESSMKEDLFAVRDNHRLYGHMKWTKVTNQKIQGYCDFVNAAFRSLDSGQARFRCLVVDTRLYPLDHPIHSNRDSELGFYKFYYQLLFHWLDPRQDYEIHLAERNNHADSRLIDLRSALNNGVRKKCGTTREVVRAVRAEPAKSNDLIQVADILMGAIGYHYHHLEERPDARQAKNELADLISRKVGKSNLRFSTGVNASRFNVFCFSPK